MLFHRKTTVCLIYFGQDCRKIWKISPTNILSAYKIFLRKKYSRRGKHKTFDRKFKKRASIFTWIKKILDRKKKFVQKEKKKTFLMRISFLMWIFFGEKFFSDLKKFPNKKRASIFTWIQKFRQEKKKFVEKQNKFFFWWKFFFFDVNYFLVRNFFFT